MKIKITTGELSNLSKDKIYSVVRGTKYTAWVSVYDDIGCLHNISYKNFCIVEENGGMKELTLSEILARKTGKEEYWDGDYEDIKVLEDGRIKFIWKTGEDNLINPKFTYRLARNKVTFQEAFKAFEEGKVIESCVSGCKFKKEGDRAYYKEPYDEIFTVFSECAFFEEHEIRGEWHINED